MRIRTKQLLITAGLMAAVVVSIAATVIHTQKKVLRDQSLQRRNVIMESAARIGKEALDDRDRLMAVSYLMFLRKEHPEIAFASINYRGHESKLGSEKEKMLYLERKIYAAGAAPVRYTVSAYPSASGAPSGALSVSTGGVSLQVSGKALVKVEEPAPEQGISVRLGFVRQMMDAEVDGALTPLIRRTAAIAGAFMLLGFFVNLWVAKWLTRPIEELAAATALLAAGRMDVSVPVRTNDELGKLTGSFNSMAGRLRELLESREDILHTLTHEINTPLNGLKGYLELWEDKKLPPEPAAQQAVIGTMMAAVVRMENSLSNALDLFRAEHKAASGEDLRLVRVDEVFRQTLTLFAPMAAAKGIRVLPMPPATDSFVRADEESVRRIATNLVSNAIKYTPDHGQMHVGFRNTPGHVVVCVSNTGYGIPAKDIPHLFTKFYRSGAERAEGKRIPGTGLGLNIVYKAVTALGGKIWVDSKVGQSTIFLVKLPKADDRIKTA